MEVIVMVVMIGSTEAKENMEAKSMERGRKEGGVKEGKKEGGGGKGG
jgi:hypothetical protein